MRVPAAGLRVLVAAGLETPVADLEVRVEVTVVKTMMTAGKATTSRTQRRSGKESEVVTTIEPLVVPAMAHLGETRMGCIAEPISPGRSTTV
jgi:hypothetical protein